MTTSKRPRAQGEEADLRSRLDHLTLSRKEGFGRLADAPPRPRPEPLSRRQLKSLGEAALAEYNRGRRKWHANLGPLVTPQMEELHEDLSDIFDSNDQDSDKVKGGIALDAFPGWARPQPCSLSPGNSTVASSRKKASTPTRDMSGGPSAVSD
ncbi:hypothetical protein AB0I52_17245 [Streptomyces sp. NPDC050423]|uniref:hypothetical protein n=1 Tax=Streptomyces sp. NPDC050423 TaxID=3155402 RepID=UPI00341283DE